MTIIKLLPKNPNWQLRATTDTIVLHHAQASRCTIVDIDRWHREDNHWEGGCGYHFLVSKDCKIYEGRPIDIEGAHCVGWNHRSIGICFEGDFNQEKMSLGQEQKGIELIRWIRDKYKMPLRILRHKDANPGSTECPGENFRNIIILEGSKDIMENQTVHWAQGIYDELKAKGITINETRFNDNITRAETMALLVQILRKVEGAVG
jgi:hypothetical protein